MKRTILPLIFVSFAVVMFGVGAFVGVLYFTMKDPAGGPKDIPQPPYHGFSVAELEDLQTNPVKAAAVMPRLLVSLEEGDEEVQVHTAEVLKIIGEPAVNPVRAELRHKNAKARFWAAQTLGAIGPAAKDAVEDLLKCLKDPDPSVRYKAVYALGRLDVRSTAVFAGLLAALEDKGEGVIDTALAVLDNIGAPPKEALPALSTLAAKGSTHDVRVSAMKLLARLGPTAVPVFRDLIKQAEPEYQAAWLGAILTLGPDARPLVPDLVPIMEKEIREAPGGTDLAVTVEIFKKCGPDGAKGLTEMLVKADRLAVVHRQWMLKGIGEMREEAEVKATVPILVELLQSKKADSDFRREILGTLGEIGVPARAAIPTVETLTSDKALREAARVALRRMGKVDAK